MTDPVNVRMQHPDSIDPRHELRAQGTAPEDAEPAPEGEESATGTPDPTEGVAELSYEQARDELVAVVRRLESGELPLEAALDLWRRGEALADRCQSWLDGARRALDEARAGSQDDEPGEEGRP